MCVYICTFCIMYLHGPFYSVSCFRKINRLRKDVNEYYDNSENVTSEEPVEHSNKG